MMKDSIKKTVLLFYLFCLFIKVSAQDKPAYVLYNANGKKVSYTKMITDIVQNDVLLFGEFHNNPISHWLQLKVTKDCKQKVPIALGAEMFEQDNQLTLNNYLQGKLTAKGLATEARLWNNYTTDYAPLVNFAKENNISFTATNVPRKYATMVSKKGFDALDTLVQNEKKWLAPLPILFDSTLAGYKNMLTMMEGHGTVNMIKAQALKDATMAYFINKNLLANGLFIHYNGSYHSDNFDGIFWHLKQRTPSLKIITISTVSQKDITTLLAENKNKANYIICVDEDMTSTF